MTYERRAGKRAQENRMKMYKEILSQLPSGHFRVSFLPGKILRISHYTKPSQEYLFHCVVKWGMPLGHIEKVGPSTYQRTEKGEKYAKE